MLNSKQIEKIDEIYKLVARARMIVKEIGDPPMSTPSVIYANTVAATDLLDLATRLLERFFDCWSIVSGNSALEMHVKYSGDTTFYVYYIFHSETSDRDGRVAAMECSLQEIGPTIRCGDRRFEIALEYQKDHFRRLFEAAKRHVMEKDVVVVTRPEGDQFICQPDWLRPYLPKEAKTLTPSGFGNEMLAIANRTFPNQYLPVSE